MTPNSSPLPNKERVESNGLISANLGTVTLAAGKQSVLTFDTGGLLGVRVSQETLL